MKIKDIILCIASFFSKLNYYKNIHKNYMENIVEYKYLDSLNIATASHCNLNCKNCHVFAPLAKEEFVTLKQLSKDLKKLKDLAPERNLSLNFMGGEPLLNPEFLKLIECSRKIYPNSIISAISNGILLNKQDEKFWETIKSNNVEFRVTKYPIDIQREIYEKKAKKYGVEIEYAGIRWNKSVLDLTGSQDPKHKRLNCKHKGIIHYARGNIYYCFIHTYINSFIDYFNLDIEITPNDYIKIEDVKDIREIDYFLSTPKPLCKYCKYCHNTCYGGDFLQWGISKHEISEWT